MPPNILQLQREVESLPDDRLIMEAQNPSMFPSYLIAQEIERREQGRKAEAAQMAQQPQASVYEQKIQQFGQGMLDAFSGIGALGGVQTAARGGMIGYADGGLLGYQDGGEVDPETPYQRAQRLIEERNRYQAEMAKNFALGAGRFLRDVVTESPGEFPSQSAPLSVVLRNRDNMLLPPTTAIEGSAPFSSQITAGDQVAVEGSRPIPRTDGPPFPVPQEAGTNPVPPEAGTKKQTGIEDILAAYGISNKPRDVVAERIAATLPANVSVQEYYGDLRKQAEAMGGLTEEEQALQAYRESLAERLMGRLDPEMDRMDIQSYIFSRVGQQARGEEEGTMYGGVRSLMESQRERNELLEDRANAIREANLATTAAARRAAMNKVFEVDSKIAELGFGSAEKRATEQAKAELEAAKENARNTLEAAIHNSNLDADFANRLLGSFSAAQESEDVAEMLRVLNGTMEAISLAAAGMVDDEATKEAQRLVLAAMREYIDRLGARPGSRATVTVNTG